MDPGFQAGLAAPVVRKLLDVKVVAPRLDNCLANEERGQLLAERIPDRRRWLVKGVGEEVGFIHRAWRCAEELVGRGATKGNRSSEAEDFRLDTDYALKVPALKNLVAEAGPLGHFVGRGVFGQLGHPLVHAT